MKQLKTKHIGRRLLVYDRVESTNSIALEFAKDRANDGTVVLAHEQTAGRGRHGRNWYCPPGAGVLLSLVIFPPEHVRRPVILTAWAAVSVVNAIRRSTGLEARIKWPNDVLVRGKKVAGILIEHGAATVVGIGLNVNQTEQDLQLMGLSEASSFSLFCGRRFDVGRVAEALIESLDALYDGIQNGGLSELLTSWRGSLGVLGREVVVHCQDRIVRGHTRHLDWEALHVDVPGEGNICIRPENIRQVHVVGTV